MVPTKTIADYLKEKTCVRHQVPQDPVYEWKGTEKACVIAEKLNVFAYAGTEKIPADSTEMGYDRNPSPFGGSDEQNLMRKKRAWSRSTWLRRVLAAKSCLKKNVKWIRPAGVILEKIHSAQRSASARDVSRREQFTWESIHERLKHGSQGPHKRKASTEGGTFAGQITIGEGKKINHSARDQGLPRKAVPDGRLVSPVVIQEVKKKKTSTSGIQKGSSARGCKVPSREKEKFPAKLTGHPLPRIRTLCQQGKGGGGERLSF